MQKATGLDDSKYAELEEDFFDRQTRNWNPIRSWFHISRNMLVMKCVKERYKEGDAIVDLGCGNCLWNTEKLPVTGIDVNEKMMRHAKEKGRLANYYVGNINATPLKPNSVNIVVITETLEHIGYYHVTIEEIRRILKTGGVVVATVPYDTNLSLWKPLFAVQCFIQGNILGKELYKNKCGHVNHFSPKSIQQEFAKRGFQIEEQFHNKFFTIITICSKR